MKAAVLTTPAPISQLPLKIEDVPTPDAQPGHVLLKVLACGVCRTDLHIVEGELSPLHPRIIPGHQIVGEVIAGELEASTAHVGTGALTRPEHGSAKSILKGSRVGVSWIGGT